MDTPVMNKQWIEYCHVAADFVRTCWYDVSITGSEQLIQYNYLIAIGLFESAWFSYDKQYMDEFEDNFGYPGNE